MVSKQRKQLLEILSERGVATPKKLEEAYNDNYGSEIGNVHEQLNRLVENILVTRTDNGYKITEEGLKYVKNKHRNTGNTDIFLTDKEVEEIKKIGERDDTLEYIKRHAYPELLGLDDAKLACLASAVSLSDKGSSKNRVSVLLYGEKGTGKTALMKNTIDLIDGEQAGTSGCQTGLRGQARGSTYKKGSLQRADQTAIGIDELGKYSNTAQDALLEAMNDGQVKINIDQVNKTTDTRVRVIATANHINALKTELRDRFDMEIQVDTLDTKQKKKLLVRNANNWNRETNIDRKLIKKYIYYCNQIDTSLPENRENIINAITESFDSIEHITARRLEGVFRLSLAIARLRLKEIVDEEDIKVATNLLKKYV